MTDRELLEKALKALEEISGGYSQNLIAALRERLAQPEQEPIAWIERDMQCDDFDPDSVTCQKQDIAAAGWEWVALYTAPPRREWVGLTEDEIKDCEKQSMVNGALPFEQRSFFARAIEAKLKEKNNG